MHPFVQVVKKACKKNKIDLVLKNTPYVKFGNITCSGVFSESESSIIIATQKPETDWLAILVHEFNHMNQFCENTKIWRDSYIAPPCDSFYFIQLWLSYFIELNKDQKNKYIELSQKIEWDCEKRSIQTKKEYDLPIDIKTYSQKANSYIYFYQIVKKYRTWYDNLPPYEYDDVINAMPTKILPFKAYQDISQYEQLYKNSMGAKWSIQPDILIPSIK